jgi:hypothetical protein
MRAADCKKLEEHIVDLIEHSLPSELQKEMQAHLADCPHCERLVRDFSDLWEELGLRVRREPPESLWPSLRLRLEAQWEHPFRSSAFLTGLLGLLRPAALSLAVLLAVLAGFQLGGPRGEYASGLQITELSPELRQEAYASFYLGPFTDIPEGSLADFYLGAETLDEEKSP